MTPSETADAKVTAHQSRMKLSEEQIKCRVISFRLSDHEYCVVESASQKHGFTSISLFARSATLMCGSTEPTHSPLDIEINRVWRRVEALTAALEEITAHIGIALEPSV